VAVTTLTRPDAPQVDGLILTAPAVWAGAAMSPLYKALLAIMSRIAPNLELTGRSLGIQASDNLPMLMALGRDPLFIKSTRVGVVAGLVRLMDEARRAAPQLETPTFVLIGGRDEVIPAAAQWTFVRQIGAPRCAVASYPNGWHLLLRDLDRQLVWNDILAWIGRRPPPSGLARPCRPSSATPVVLYEPLSSRSAASG
jgi:alpha-beta hydrolase superfamily lysophospholipase